MERRTSSLCLSWTGGYIHFVLTPHRALRFGLRPVQAAGRAAARATPPPSPRRKIASAAPAAAGPQPRPPAPPAALFELSAMVDSGHDSLGRTEWAVLWSRTEPARWSRTPTAPSPVSSLATAKGGAGSAAAATEEDGAGSFFRKFPSVPVRTIILARKLSGEDEAQTPKRNGAAYSAPWTVRPCPSPPSPRDRHLRAGARPQSAAPDAARAPASLRCATYAQASLKPGEQSLGRCGRGEYLLVCPPPDPWPGAATGPPPRRGRRRRAALLIMRTATHASPPP